MLTKTLIATVALVALAGSVSAQDAVRLSARQDSKLWIEGGSNVHDWKCEASSVDASVDMAADYAAPAATMSRALQRVNVRVPVGNLRCGNGQMDRNLQRALKAQEAPHISYIMANFEVQPGASNSEFTVKTVGTLTVAGRSNQLRMDVAARRMPDGTLRAQGSVPILMTHYGITPPVALLGTLRVADQVTVKFDLVIAPQNAVAAADH